jgi:Fuc2NAc and GlcNAc transferase
MQPILLALLVSSSCLWLFIRVAPRLGLIDRPNARSLHERPTVVGAGIAPVLGAMVGWLLWPAFPVAAPVGLSLAIAALLVTGLADDRYPLPSAPRLLVYAGAVASVLALEWWGQLPPFAILVLLPGLLWLINLYNFMDGADGVAGLQLLLVALGMGLLCQFGPAPALAPFWWILAAAMLPFLLLNWPPARCFLGDAGAIPLGMLLGVGGVLSAMAERSLGLAWLVLMMPFLVDATGTLLLRLRAGYSPVEPHRDHAYQRIARRTGSPLVIDLGLALLHLLWQFPLAMTVVTQSLFTPIAVIFSAIPTLLLLVYVRRAA